MRNIIHTIEVEFNCLLIAHAVGNVTLRFELQNLITLLHLLRIDIHLLAHRFELLRHLRHAGFFIIERRRVIAHVLRDLHRTEFRPAHRAEMRQLVRLLRQRLVVILARGVGIEPEVELVLPAEVEARA